MVVDFSNLTDAQRLIYRNLRNVAIQDYNNLCFDLLEVSDKSLGWLINNATSRNTNFSNLLTEIQCLRFIETIISENSIEKIVINNDKALQKTIRSKYPNIRIEGYNQSFVRDRFNRFKNLLSYIIRSYRGLRSRSATRLKNIAGIKDLILVDTDLPRKRESYWDRYYTGMYEMLPDDMKVRTYYLVMYLPVPSKKDLFAIEKNSQENIVFTTDLLCLNDYITAFKAGRKLKKIDFAQFSYLGYNLKDCIETAFTSSNSVYFYYGFLMERVIKNLRKWDIDLSLMIDWFENQSFDKSLHYSMNKYFPSVPVNSYIGFIADEKIYPHVTPTNQELDLHIAPQNVYVCCELLKRHFQKSGYKGNLFVAPAFRNQNVFKLSRKKQNKEVKNILVPLALDAYDVSYKYKYFKSISQTITSKIQIWFKPHPAFDLNGIEDFETCNVKFNIVSGDIYKWLVESDVLIASNSTVTFEGLSIGVPAITIEDPEGKLLIERPDSVPDELWYEVYNEEEFLKAIDFIFKLDFDALCSYGNTFRSLYFEPVTDYNKLSLFNNPKKQQG